MNCSTCKKSSLFLSLVERPLKNPLPNPPPSKNFNCGVCGISLQNSKYIKACSDNCGQFLCVMCNTCPKGHALIKAYKLSQISPNKMSPYFNNNYKCKICNTLKNVSLDNKSKCILRCIPCCYDICMHHVFRVTHSITPLDKTVSSNKKPRFRFEVLEIVQLLFNPFELRKPPNVEGLKESRKAPFVSPASNFVFGTTSVSPPPNPFSLSSYKPLYYTDASANKIPYLGPKASMTSNKSIKSKNQNKMEMTSA